MTPGSALVNALALPLAARVDQRIAKKLLLEQGKPSAADKRVVNDALAELHWVAALKPGTVGLAPYRDGERDITELAVLLASLRSDVSASHMQRLAQIVHRAVPYEVVLVLRQGDGATALEALSLATKRLSLNPHQPEQQVAEAFAATPLLPAQRFAAGNGDAAISERAFAASLALASPLAPWPHLHARYLGWWWAIEALSATAATGRFSFPADAHVADARRQALQQRDELQREVAALRAAAAREAQLSRRVDLNLRIRHKQAELARTLGDL